MKELEQKYIDILESMSWNVSSYTDDGRVELEWYTPAGEDFNICVEVDNFPDAVAKYAADFDVDEHIELHILARRSGVSGIPSARELVHDAEYIDKYLQELAAALRAADGSLQCDPCHPTEPECYACEYFGQGKERGNE